MALVSAHGLSIVLPSTQSCLILQDREVVHKQQLLGTRTHNLSATQIWKRRMEEHGRGMCGGLV